MRVHAREILAVDAQRPGGRRLESRQGPQQGCLPGARRAQNGYEGPAFDMKGTRRGDPNDRMLLGLKGTLSEAELLAILISTGTKEDSALDLAKKVMQLTQNDLHALGKLSLNDFRKVKGIGSAKAVTMIAAMELGRRRKENAISNRLQILLAEMYNGALK